MRDLFDVVKNVFGILKQCYCCLRGDSKVHTLYKLVSPFFLWWFAGSIALYRTCLSILSWMINWIPRRFCPTQQRESAWWRCAGVLPQRTCAMKRPSAWACSPVPSPRNPTSLTKLSVMTGQGLPAQPPSCQKSVRGIQNCLYLGCNVKSCYSARPRALVQNLRTRELISTQEMTDDLGLWCCACEMSCVC